MLECNRFLQLPLGAISIKEPIRKKPTYFEYIGASESEEWLIKSIPIPTAQLLELMSQELANLKLVPEDPHILKLIDHTIIESDQKIGILKFEFPANRTLKRFMKIHELDEDQISYIFKEILLAVIKINDHGIVHRDINPNNIWIDKDYCFKLSGFERSIRLDDNRASNIVINSQRLNHPCLRPPDLIESFIPNKVDIWGLGCLLYYLIARKYPLSTQIQEISAPSNLREILNLCLSPNPDDRPLPRVILNMITSHKIPTLPFFFKSSNLDVICLKYSGKYCLNMCLTPDPVSPDLFYMQQTTFLTRTQPERINELLLVIKGANNTLTVTTIKSLIIMHRLMLSGPKEILTKILYENLENILSTWTAGVENKKDEYNCEYFSGLIRQLARIFMEKIRFHIKTATTSDWKSQLKPSDFNEGIAYLNKVIRICEGLSIGMSIIPSINSFLSMQLVEESQRLINSLTSLDKNFELNAYTTRLNNIGAKKENTKFVNYESETVVKPSTKNLMQKTLGNFKSFNTDLNSPEMNNKSFYASSNNATETNPKPLNPIEKKNEFNDLLNLDTLPSPGIPNKVSTSASNPSEPVLEISFQTPPEVIYDSSSKPNINISKSDAPKPPIQNSNSYLLDMLDFNPPIQKNPKTLSKLPDPNQYSHNRPRAIKSSSNTNQSPQNVSNPNPRIRNSASPTSTSFDFRSDKSNLIQLIPISSNPTSASKTSSIKVIHKSIETLQGVPIKNHIPKPNNFKSTLPQNSNQIKSIEKPSGLSLKSNRIDSSIPEPKIFPIEVPPNPPEPKPKLFSIEKRWVMAQSDIKLGPILGSGASCIVYKGEYKRTPVAIKMMRESYSGQNIIQEFQREVSAMVTLRHPNLVLFMGASIEPSMMIISEFCAGESLYKLLHERKNIMLHWRQKLKMIIDIARGMLYLHEANPPILHRDLKSLNLLLLDQVNTSNDHILVKITDFGIARILEEAEARMTVRMGTCHWMAPEVINSEPYSLAADVYSFGIVVWEIAARDTPYRGVNPVQIPMKVLQGERPDLNAIVPGIPSSIKDLIKICWDQSPSKRPTFKQIMEFLQTIQGSDEF